MKRRAVLALLLACGTRTTVSRCRQDLPGPPFVETTAGCIDATEVTNADYLAFLSDPDHRAACGDRLEPLFDWPPSADRLVYPVVNVDWCGASSYCAWAGKTLCTADAFATTCGELYPYGRDYEPKACNGQDLGEGRVLPAHALAGCEGSPRGVYDMSGNVWEWLADAHDGGFALGGGGFRNDRYNLQCNAFFMAPPTTRYDYYGFRCCSR